MILITGGARSGKSVFAEQLLQKENSVLYIATSIVFDKEMEERVKLHKERRKKEWDTLEAYRNVGEKILDLNKGYKGIMLDCVTIMISNLLMEAAPNFTDEEYNNLNYREEEKKILCEMKRLVEAVKQMESKYNTKVVFVTNEVGAGIVPENKLSREFRDIAGKVNQYLAKEAENVYLVVSGIPVKIKG